MHVIFIGWVWLQKSSWQLCCTKCQDQFPGWIDSLGATAMVIIGNVAGAARESTNSDGARIWQQSLPQNVTSNLNLTALIK